MGWTSFTYTETTHLKFTAQHSLDFCKREFDTDGYKIIKFWHQKAESLHDNNVAYLVLEHPDGYNFILVVLISIQDREIYFKEICASSGPVVDKCPVEFLKLVKMPEPSTYEYDWFIKVMKNNVRYKEQVKI